MRHKDEPTARRPFAHESKQQILAVRMDTVLVCRTRGILGDFAIVAEHENPCFGAPTREKVSGPKDA